MKGKTIEIQIVDPVESRVWVRDKTKIAPHISYPASYWIQGRYRKRRVDYTKYMWHREAHKGHYYFLTGLLPRITKGLRAANVDYRVVGLPNLMLGDEQLPMPKLKNIVFREDQEEVLTKALRRKRGVIVAPTGSGKTILMGGLLKTFTTDAKGLVLAHTNDLVRQALSEFKKFGFKSVGMCGEGTVDLSKHITVSTIQTFSKLPNLKKISCDYQCIIIDEAHHAKSATYQKVLTTLLAPHRFGVTATVPEEGEGEMAMEGILGRVIAEISLGRAEEDGLLAKPIIKLLRPPKLPGLTQIKNYRAAYTAGIVENQGRNKFIIDEVKKLNQSGKSCLIMVVNKAHGRTLSRLGGMPFVRGATEGEERENFKKALNDKKILSLITSVVFREGVNIRTLDCVVLAGGGKGELPLLQSIGRGLRKFGGKEECIVMDFLDLDNKHLLFHLGHRLEVYSKLGWL